MIQAALFDLDGVVFDTEPQYTCFWGSICREFHPELPGLEQRVKGQTLVEILGNHFAGERDRWEEIVRRLDDFERQMAFDYVAGFEDFVADLRQNGVRTAVVTSSNQVKMEAVYRKRPELRGYFDRILTSEDFAASKPAPDCYLKGAQEFGLGSDACVVFEDSFNGLKSGRAARMTVVGLSTTNPAEAIQPLSDLVIPDYIGLDYEKICEKLK